MAEPMDMDDVTLMSMDEAIIQRIFSHLNDTDLLNATRICRQVKTIATEIFANKYNGESDDKYFEVTIYTDDSSQEPKPYWPFFTTFGYRMTSLKLNLNIDFMNCTAIARSHWLIRTINRKCTSLSKLKVTLNGEEAPFSITGLSILFSKLTQLSLHKLRMTNSNWAVHTYESLTHFYAIKVKGFFPADLSILIRNHPRLQYLAIVRCDQIKLNILEVMHDTCKELLALDLITFDGSFMSELDEIQMPKLESLKISVGHGSSMVSVLSAVSKGCKNLQNLEFMPVKMDNNCEIRGDIIDVISSFHRLRRVDVS